MKQRLELDILPQPDDTTCGPTCLHAIYRFHGDVMPLDQLISEVERLEHGGTYAAYLARHALDRGYDVRLFTWNVEVFDPTWFELSPSGMAARLSAREKFKAGDRTERAHRAYLEFLTAGGEIEFEDLTTRLIRKFLNRGTPIITGLSSTFLYRAMRERGMDMDDDDIRGDPQGHFVVLCGYDKEDRTVLVADPMHPNPAFQGLQYVVDIDRLVSAILLGVLTHDADLLVIEPRQDDADDQSDDAESERGRARPRRASTGKANDQGKG
jgi:hypothetical protein